MRDVTAQAPHIQSQSINFSAHPWKWNVVIDDDNSKFVNRKFVMFSLDNGRPHISSVI